MRRLALLLGAACGVVILASVVPAAHPHDELDLFDARGTLTKIDLVNNVIEVDTIDARTKIVRNELFRLDRRTKIRNGRARLQLANLQAGQRVVCVVERFHRDGQKDRLIALEIRVENRS
jgi:hypothetical protein